IEDGERRRERPAVRFAAAHREAADAAEGEPEDGDLEDLALGHVADGAPESELDPRRVLPVEVVRDHDERPAWRDPFRPLDAPGREERRDRADGRIAQAPHPEPLLREDRRPGEDGAHVATGRWTRARTRSSASRTERPSVSTTTASAAIRRGASARCCSTIAARTAGTRATWETIRSMSAVRIAHVTSAPSRRTVYARPSRTVAGPMAMRASRARPARRSASSGSTERRRPASAI